jgi:hypothetical protein
MAVLTTAEVERVEMDRVQTGALGPHYVELDRVPDVNTARGLNPQRIEGELEDAGIRFLDADDARVDHRPDPRDPTSGDGAYPELL